MSLDAASLQDYVKGHLAQAAKDKGLALPEIGPDTNLLELGVVDSLGFVQMLLSMEAAFGIELDLAELDPDEFTTLEGLVQTALASAQAA